MSDSPTPETDAEAMDGICCYGDPLKSWDYKPSKDGEVVPAEFARKLERERYDALKEWDLARDGWSKALEERDEARRARDEARNALEWIAGRYCHEKTTVQLAQEAYEMSSKARWTLQQIEQKEEA